MANYYASARTNYFKVKDLYSFKEEVKDLYIELIEEEDGSVCILESGDGGFPLYNPETDEEIDIVEVVSRHLRDEEVAIFMEVGAEKLRYLSGHATAVNNKGEIRTVNLGEIYKLAEELGKNVTRAEY